MPDEKDESVKEELSELHSGTDWGEDWESAFQAEDDFFVADDADIADFPLDDPQSSAAAPPPSPPQQPSDLAGPNDETVITNVTPEISATPSQESGLAATNKLATLKKQILGLYYSLRTRFLAAKLITKIIGGAVLTCLIILTSLVFILAPAPKLAQKNAGLKLAMPLPSPVQPQKEPEQLRTKWKYGTFFIPVASSGKDTPQAFIELSITLILMLDKDEALPEDKKTFTRDLIYQFFTNRPLYELRRFTLARGEMNRKLKEWIRKQWPDGPIESIVFNRYQVS